MIQYSLSKFSLGIAKEVLIEYTKSEVLSLEQSEILKKIIIDKVEIFVSHFFQEEDFTPKV